MLRRKFHFPQNSTVQKLAKNRFDVEPEAQRTIKPRLVIDFPPAVLSQLVICDIKQQLHTHARTRTRTGIRPPIFYTISHG